MEASEKPQSTFSSAVCDVAKKNLEGVLEKKRFIGKEAVENKGIGELAYPIVNGIIEDWEKMEAVWRHCFMNELRVLNCDEYSGIMLTEAPRQPKVNRERMVTAMFETFKFQRVYIGIQAVLSLFAAGRTTGLVMDCGDGVMHTVPAWNGFQMTHGVARTPIAGRALSEFMRTEI